MTRRLQALACAAMFAVLSSTPAAAARQNVISFKDDPHARTMPVYQPLQGSVSPGPGRYEKRKPVKGKRYAAVRRTAASPQPAHQWGGGDLASRAQSYIGMTAAQIGLRRTLWCAAFINHIAGPGRGTGSDYAKSFLSKPRVAPQVGAIAVMNRGKRAKDGHAGIVDGFDASGNPILISGNHNNRVARAVYPRHRILAYVMP